jgi:hypothetical protein
MAPAPGVEELAEGLGIERIDGSELRQWSGKKNS